MCSACGGDYENPGTEEVELKVGMKVEGNSFPEGKVLRLGTAKQLVRFDVSDAVTEAVREGLMMWTEQCVAVEFEDGVAVYPVEEVWAK